MNTTTRLKDHLVEVIRKAVAAWIEGIPGVGHIDINIASFNNSRTEAMSDISFHGWSATLHPVRVAHIVTLELEKNERMVPDDELVEKIFDVFAPIISRQIARATDAARLGADKPLPFEQHDHLTVDVAYHPICALQKKDPRALLTAALRQAHVMLADNGDSEMTASGIMALEQRAPDGSWQRIAQPYFQFHDAAGNHVASWQGKCFTLYCGQLPQSLVDAMEGKPLGEIAPVHSLLDTRPIKSAWWDKFEVSLDGGDGDYTYNLYIDFVPDETFTPDGVPSRALIEGP